LIAFLNAQFLAFCSLGENPLYQCIETSADLLIDSTTLAPSFEFLFVPFVTPIRA